MGSAAGYYSARIYKLFHGKEWKKNTLLAALFYPSVMGTIFLGINFFVWYMGSSTAAPFSTLFSLLLLWLGVSTPLVFIGSYFGFKKEAIEVPVRTNQILRHIPEQVIHFKDFLYNITCELTSFSVYLNNKKVWYTHPAFSIALGGILPYGAVCIELFFIMSAMWLHQVYTSL
jgi:transmembrane 9 superfamily protein 2/4